MKDFVKWLGVNEKIAKVAVWLLIIIIFLVMTNAMLESIGAPHYKLTIENLSNVKYSKVLEYLCAWIQTMLSFLSIILFIFPIKDFKKLLKYTFLYLITNILVVSLFDYTISQIFIFVFIILFCFLYSKKNWKYLLYGICSLLLNTGIQYLSYAYKLKFVDYETCSTPQRLILSLDFYIIIFLIILIKEIYWKERRKKNV